MKRFAVIVKGSTNDRFDDPPGITADANNLVDWLRSNEGGAWELEEIHSLNSPSSDSLQDPYLRIASASDYALLAFFGHGRGVAGKPDEMRLQINKNEDIALNTFVATSKWSLRMIDACREVVPDELLEGVTKVAAAPQIWVNRLREKHRDLFDESLSKSNPGSVTMMACSPNMNAYGTAIGGRFTSSVISAARLWSMTGYHPPKSMGTDELFNEAEYWTRKLEPAQYPQLLAVTSLPFAVIAS